MASPDMFQFHNFQKTLCIRITCFLTLLVCSFTKLYSQSYQIGICSGTTFNFTPPGAIPGTTYTWLTPTTNPPGTITGGSTQLNQSSVSQTLTNTGTSPATATYTVTTSVPGTFTLIVTVSPLPVLSSTPPSAVCSSVPYTYVPASATTGTNISWSRNQVAGISNTAGQGNGNINEILINTTTNPVTVNYVFALTANNCTNLQTVPVTVNPTPTLSSSLTPPSICSGTTFNYTPTSLVNNPSFTWIRNPVAGINNSTGNNGTASVSEQLLNTTLSPIQVSYAYTVTNNATGCANNNQIVRVYVNPVPNISSQPAINSCSGNSFFSSPAPGSIAPFGTLYTWTTPVINPAGAITGGSAQSVGQPYISQSLTNTTASTATAVYTVTPNTNGCVGSAFNVTVNVNTTSNSVPVLSSSLTPPDICSESIFSYQPTSTTIGFSAAWTRFNTNGISSGYSTGSGNPNEPLVNITTLPVTVAYAYTLTAPGGCSNTQSVSVIVNPTPSLSSTQTPVAICSNTIFSYVPTSNTPNTAFTWSRGTVPGISNPAATGTNNPNEILINTTNLPVTVTYNYSLISANGCTRNQPVTVQVNPAPVLSSLLNPPAICSGSTFNYTPASATATSFTWTRPVVPGISNGAGAGTGNPSEILVNTTIAPVTVLYSYTLTGNGCSGNQTVSVQVNPTPNINNLTTITCSNTAFTVSPTGVPANTQYTWTMPANNPAGSITGDTTQPNPQNSISQLLINQTLNPATATYTVTPIANACTGASFTIAVTVNPVPIVANQLLTAICSGTAFSYASGNVPSGTTYTWSNPILAPSNSLTGGSAQSISQANISQTLSSTNNLTDTAAYTITPSAYGCPGNTFTVTVPVKPVPVINNVSDTICSGSSFSIAPAPVPANTTYTWPTPVNFPFGSVIGGRAQVTPASTISQTLINTTNNTAQTVYTISPTASGCSGVSFILTVTVGVPLPFIPNQTALICSGTAFDATPVTARPGTTYTWNIPTVTPPGSVTGISAASTPQNTVSQTLTNLTTVTDTVVYNVSPYNTGCRGNLFTATVRVIALPRATITGNAVVCRYPFDTLSVSFTGMGPWNFTYLNDTIPGTQTGITTSPYRWVVPAVPNIPTRKLRITNVRDMACFNNKDTSVFVQKVNPLPVGKIISLHGIYLCNNITDTLFISASAADTLKYQWTLNGTPITGATTDSIATLQQGNYNAILTNQYGCIDTASASLRLIMITQPMLKFSYDSYCINIPVNFTNHTDTTFTGAIQWLWNFGDSTTATTYNGTTTYLTGGDRHIRLTAKQLYCQSYSTSMDTTLNIQFPIKAITMPSVSAYKGVFTPLNARVIAGYRYKWVPSWGLDRPDSSVTNFNYTNTQQYLINLISPGGCMTPDTMLVRVFDNGLVDILVPKSFTPNGDGINDILYPYLTGIKEFHYFKVFNRYGKLMFETKNPDAGWNGNFDGSAQPMSIYIWVAEGIANDGSLVQKKGETLLLR